MRIATIVAGRCRPAICYAQWGMPQVWINARIRFLTSEEGGHAQTIRGPSSYRPNHNFGGPEDRKMCIGEIKFAEGEEAKPGDTIERDLILVVDPEDVPELRPGREWRVQEGGTLVAMAMILKVLGSE